MEINDQDEVVRRLHALGEHPVPPDVAERHAAYLAAATPVAGRSRMRPLLAGSLLAGALLGGTGLAAALPGSLPEQASSVAKGALEAVNLVEDDEPKDPAKEAAKAQRKAARAQAKAANAASGQGVVRFTQGCTVGNPPVPFTGNHGQYVKAHPDLPNTPDVNEREVAAQSNCGKPLVAVTNKANAGAQGTQSTNKPADAGKPADTGRPESPGKSEDTHPPADAQSSTTPGSTAPGTTGDAGKSAENRPEDAGPPTTTTTSTTTTTTSTP